MFLDWLYCKAGSDLCVEQTLPHLHLMSLVVPVHVGSRLCISALHLPMVRTRWGPHSLTSGILSYLHLESAITEQAIDPFSHSFIFVTCTYLLTLNRLYGFNSFH